MNNAEKKEAGLDRRVRKTRKLLKQGLLSLLMEKNIEEITIKELVEKVDINRGTFYLHCRDIRDLFHQIEDEAMEKLTGVFDNSEPSDLKGNLTTVFSYLTENKELTTLMLLKNGDMAFVEKMKQWMEQKCFQQVRRMYQGNQEEQYEWYAAYAVSGCIGILQHWLQSNMETSPQDLAVVASELIHNGMKSLG